MNSRQKVSEAEALVQGGIQDIVVVNEIEIRLVPGHCDPTVNLHDWLVCVRGERVEALWSIAARGALF